MFPRKVNSIDYNEYNLNLHQFLFCINAKYPDNSQKSIDENEVHNSNNKEYFEVPFHQNKNVLLYV